MKNSTTPTNSTVTMMLQVKYRQKNRYHSKSKKNYLLTLKVTKICAWYTRAKLITKEVIIASS